MHARDLTEINSCFNFLFIAYMIQDIVPSQTQGRAALSLLNSPKGLSNIVWNPVQIRFLIRSLYSKGSKSNCSRSFWLLIFAVHWRFLGQECFAWLWIRKWAPFSTSNSMFSIRQKCLICTKRWTYWIEKHISFSSRFLLLMVRMWLPLKSKNTQIVFHLLLILFCCQTLFFRHHSLRIWVIYLANSLSELKISTIS